VSVQEVMDIIGGNSSSSDLGSNSSGSRGSERSKPRQT
jgi:hypothetical protein